MAETDLTEHHDSAEQKKSDVALSEYTYTVSHSLNAPLRHIMQYGDLLKKEVGERLGADGTMYVNKIIASTKRLQGLINDLLSYAQVIHIEEKRQNLDINGMIAEVMTDMTSLIQENNVIISASNLPTIAAYTFRMRQIFYNLIINAIRYRSAADPVISIEYADKGVYFQFSVRDNGQGIEKKNHEIIFRALKRLHSQDEIEGTGLGLSICRKAVEAHGGRIWVEDNPDHGSIFFFTISKADPDQ